MGFEVKSRRKHTDTLKEEKLSKVFYIINSGCVCETYYSIFYARMFQYFKRLLSDNLLLLIIIWKPHSSRSVECSGEFAIIYAYIMQFMLMINQFRCIFSWLPIILVDILSPIMYQIEMSIQCYDDENASRELLEF